MSPRNDLARLHSSRDEQRISVISSCNRSNQTPPDGGVFGMCYNVDYFSIKRGTWLCTELPENHGGWAEAGKRRLQKVGADERCEPQPVCVMKYWATLNSQTERKQY